MPGGSLTVVGTGIRLGVDLTAGARAAIDAADELLHVAAEPVTSRWLDRLHPRSRSLTELYTSGREREAIYADIAEALLAPVREGRRVCAAFYGHPAVFVRPSHEAIRRARAEGLKATMLPAVSAEDWLFAEVGVDPGASGCASYEATDFLVRGRPADPATALVLWQIGAIGETSHPPRARPERLALLAEALRRSHPPEHEVVVYEASPYPPAASLVERLPLASLAGFLPSPLATLYVPPAAAPPRDRAMLARLGLPAAAGH